MSGHRKDRTWTKYSACEVREPMHGHKLNGAGQLTSSGLRSPDHRSVTPGLPVAVAVGPLVHALAANVLIP
jgi:hypothetical protein